MKVLDSCMISGDQYELRQIGDKRYIFVNGCKTYMKDIAKWLGVPRRTFHNRVASGHPLEAALLPKGHPYWSDAMQVGARIHRSMLESMNESDKVIGRLDPLVGVAKKSADMLRVKI